LAETASARWLLDNAKAKRDLDWSLRYPTVQSGLIELARSEAARRGIATSVANWFSRPASRNRRSATPLTRPSLAVQINAFRAADGGTLFLDEIPFELQSKLLRAVQEGQFERVGEERTRRVNVRIVAATNRNLARDRSGPLPARLVLPTQCVSD
jgi:hypothetical protein